MSNTTQLTVFASYPTYKESGVPWLGEIPSHWDVKKLKFLLSSPLKYGANESAELTNREYPRYIRITDIKDNGLLREETFRSIEPNIASNYLLAHNDILLARSGATVGKSFIYRRSWGISAYAGYLIRARIDKKIDANYIYLFCQSSSYWQWLNSIFIQATIQNVSAEKYANIKLALPPINEQQAIVQFLDKQLAYIDALVNKQKQLIKKLAEQRSAIISHAVTKGLDPNVAMKESGVEWLGKVPEHWEVMPLKYLISCNDESLNENTNPDYEMKYIDISNVSLINGIQNKEKMLFSNSPSRARRIVQYGDVIVSTVRTYLKAIAQINEMDTNLIVSTGFAVLRSREKILNKFLGYWIQSDLMVNQIVAYSNGVSYPAINSVDLIRLPMVKFPIKEQQQIVDYLDKETQKIDQITESTSKIITKLQEYRSALITQAVTGKIDVRDLVNNDTEIPLNK